MEEKSDFVLSCPLPIERYPHILMAHGGGGRLMHDLIGRMIAPAFHEDGGEGLHDSAIVNAAGARLAFTTDSYVVQPLFFPGGDIGSMAVHGTVNDLSMAGARPLCLSAAFIIEEGFPMETLWRVIQSMRQAAENIGVAIVTGDTKVVDRGKGDGIFVNTAGIGLVETPLAIAPKSVRSGDAVLLSGDIGRHGMCIMAAREGLEFESTIESDSAPVSAVVQDLLAEGIEVHCMRDLTRGGLASAMNEIAEAARVSIALEETAIPVREDVMAACEILGFDPLYVANEGRFAAFVPPQQAARALEVMARHKVCAGACRVGTVGDHPEGAVTLKTAVGTVRIVDMLSGEQLPRIC